MLHATSLHKNRECIEEVVRYICPLIFPSMGLLEILTFSAYTTKKLVLFGTKIRLKPLYVNPFIFNEQTLL